MRWHKRVALGALRGVGFDAVRRGPDLLLLLRGRPAAEWDRGFRNLLLAEHVAHVLRQGRVNCVLDVGANRGQYALELRRAQPDGGNPLVRIWRGPGVGNCPGLLDSGAPPRPMRREP